MTDAGCPYIQGQFESRYGSHSYRDTSAEALGSGVIGTHPTKKVKNESLSRGRAAMPNVRVVQTVFLENGLFVPC